MILLYVFILRPLARDAVRTVLTILAVALGVAAVVAIQLANRSAVESFRQAVDEISGRANLTVTGFGPFSEEVLLRIHEALPEAEISPVVEGVLVDRSGETIEVLAVDLATDRAVRDTNAEAIATTLDMLRVLTDPNAVLLGRQVAARHRLIPGMTPGSKWSVSSDGRQHTLTVRGVLTGDLAGNVAVMDIAAGQLLFGRIGRLDRIDLVVPADRVEAARRRVEGVLPAGLTIESPRTRADQSERMLRAFRLNLSALGLVSLIVGAFLIYNTVSISVVRRRAEIGALRAVGARRSTIVALFLAEAVLLGAAGSLAGVALGRFVADRAVMLVARTATQFWVPATAAPASLDWGLASFAIALGIAVAVASALPPAAETARVDPAESLRRGAHERASQMRSGRNAAAGLAVAAAAYFIARLPPLAWGPVFGYAAAVLIVGAAALLMPLGMARFSRAAAALLRRARSVTGALAARSLGASLRRGSVLAMALATAIGMMASVAIMVHSFRKTVETWTNQVFLADLFVRAAGERGRRAARPKIPPQLVAQIRAVPGLAAVDSFHFVEIVYRGEPAFVAAGDWHVLRRHGDLMFVDGRSAAEVLTDTPGTVVVTEPFALRYDVRANDTIRLPTPTGERAFRVAGVYYDYTSDRGYAVMNLPDWLRYGGDPAASSLAIYLAAGADTERVRAEIARVGGGFGLRITSSRELKAAVLRIFDRTFAITWVLEVIAIIVAVLGIANALLALVLERRREIGILRYIGATRAQIRRLVLWEAGLIGMLASAAGLVLGFALSLVLVYVINRQSFGWTVQFSLPIMFLIAATLGVFAVTCLTALYPARLASRIDPVETVTVE